MRKPTVHVVTALLISMQISAFAQDEKGAVAAEAQAVKVVDGQHAFDFNVGTWKTHLRRRLKPLTGSNTWVELDGISKVSKVWEGKANLVELTIDLPDGSRFEGLSLRLYNPHSKQWSLNYVNSSDGLLTPPVIGDFRNGRGEFYGTDIANGRTILVRFVISNITPDSCRFEQSFSDDGGKTWEVNWIALDTRIR